MESGQQDPSLCIQGLILKHYTEDQIMSLSQVSIEEPNSLDGIGNRTARGPSDPNLGASEDEQLCQRCGLRFHGDFSCPGHFGHVKLALPVFNSLTFPTMYKWLNMSCMGCKRLLLRSAQIILFSKQMEALDRGLITTVGKLQSLYYEMLSEGKSADKAMDAELIGRLTDCLRSDINEKGPDAESPDKTRIILDMQQNLCRNLLKKKQLVCPHCKRASKLRTIFRHESHAKLFYDSRRGGKVQKKTKRQVEDEMEEDDDDDDDFDEEDNQPSNSNLGLMVPTVAKALLREIWKNDEDVFTRLYRALGNDASSDLNSEWPTDVFFIESLLVSPVRIRPAAKMKGQIIDHPLTMNLRRVIEANRELQRLVGKRKIETMCDEAVIQTVTDGVLVTNNPDSVKELTDAWHKLQVLVNSCYDAKLGKMFKEITRGVKQVLEKKTGTMRMNMMGKRVNCAARSVISPDPCLDTHEIGLSKVFAQNLQFPEYVNEKNLAELQEMVTNGPNKYPGAAAIKFEDGNLKSLRMMSDTDREAAAKQLLTPTPGSNGIVSKTVYRHVQNGDILILNRQPTLHRPSMQAFKAKILPSENTLRINYSACKAFNADFDGDEMNAHLPQSYLSQTEGNIFVATQHQYLVPKDGTPIAGLIQDHMIGGVKLTIRGQFFNKEDYFKLVYGGLKDFKGRIQFLRPCILRPARLWSGKQVVSTILLNLVPKGKRLLTSVGKAKVGDRDWINSKPSEQWKASGDKFEYMSESHVVIRDCKLLVGVLDKNAYGASAYGLVHCYYELYGAEVASNLLSCLARVFIKFLHEHHSFTMDIGDVLVTAEGQKRWKKERTRCKQSNLEIHQRAFGFDKPDVKQIVKHIASAQFSEDTSEIAAIGNNVKNEVNPFQDDIKKACWPENLWKRFPQNGLQLMVTSGAKGNVVNLTQMVCLLGQVDLESGRPPMQTSGQTLPCVPAYAPSVHCGGFIDHRFLSGITLQDFVFHHMAGREGLVDTAVKTSKSGYLQRCLVKHLESLKVGYDLTVRDGDGTIIQFLYGEDGLDVAKAPFLRKEQFPFLIENKSLTKTHVVLDRNTAAVDKYNDKMKKWEKKHKKEKATVRTSPFLIFCKKRWDEVMGKVKSEVVYQQSETVQESELVFWEKMCKERITEEWKSLPEEKRRKYGKKSTICPAPLTDKMFPTCTFGSISEKLQTTVENFASLESNQKLFVKKEKKSSKFITHKQFFDLIYEKYQSSLAVPGESVGLLAATSIGEQTTQMTLNTFHFAGHGSMNVTLGIPRLREILMTASENISTPIAMVPLVDTSVETQKKAKKTVQKFQKVCLSEVIKAVDVVLGYSSDACIGPPVPIYKVVLFLTNPKVCKQEFGLKPDNILNHIEKKFSLQLRQFIHKSVLTFKNQKIHSEGTRGPRQKRNGNDDDEDEGDEEQSPKKDKDDESSDEEEDDVAEEKEFKQESDDEDGDDEDGEEDDENDNGKGKAKGGDGDDKGDEDEKENDEEKEKDEDGNDKENEETVNKEQPMEVDDVVMGTVDSYAIRNQRGTVTKNMKPYCVDYARSADLKSCEFSLAIDCNIELDFPTIIVQLLKETFMTGGQGKLKGCMEQEINESNSPAYMLEGKTMPDGTKINKLVFQGNDFQTIYQLQNLLSINEMYSNDVTAVARAYGIEAARVVLINEIRNVFRAYDINVDYRHLSLIADYMMTTGSYKPMNRKGMDSNPFALHKATFECATGYLKNALSEGVSDKMEPPSSRLIVGRPIGCGTGAFEVAVPMDFSE